MIFKGSYIEITNRCNLNCRDCYNSSGRNTITTELDPNVLMKYIEDLVVIYGAKNVSFSGGEPLLHSQIDDILKRLTEFAERFSNVVFSFVTNGTLHNEQFYNLLENNSQFMVQISLDGPNEEACASMRGPGTFTRVLENVKKRRFFHKPLFKMIINKTNAPYVEEYFHFVYDELGGLPCYSFANPQGNAIDNWNEMDLMPMEKAKILRIVQSKYNEYNIKDVTLPVPTVHCDLTDPNGARDFCIKPDGSVMPCQNLYDDIFCIGNINELNWNKLENNVNSLCSYLSSRTQTDYGCKKCFLKSNCGKGCPAFSYMKTKQLLQSDLDCEFRRLSTVMMIKNAKKM